MSKQSNDMDTLAELQRIKAKTTTLSNEIKSQPMKNMVSPPNSTGTTYLTVDQNFDKMHNNDYEAQQTKLAGKGAKKGVCEII
ncbi:hypothetical protein RMONA_00575 [Rickettsia monacensis]|uniref:Uncharacterized protein n=1 Tax=Rickettsia monacensis TaxID=109232 RepID=A0A0B7IX95_9RICK|nr:MULTISPECIES: hypothetical protein [Rickettsia]KJW02237.1 hypothetical protein REIP_0241 [Rickettsia endosymbiont of Ixodes pacificus]CDI28785.1 hypothetical protein RMONA_0505 [Rickettsia monacensis IrR/Munich]CEO16537.1 hypothetical protein RMONA_00575 [Rickettsia monacensis]